MDSEEVEGGKKKRSVRGRVIAGFTFALTIALSAYLLINASKSNNIAFGSLWFLAFLPAYLCALICYVGDPNGDKPSSFYWSVPPIFGGIVVLGSIYFLHEGVICLVMLSPLWLGFGWLGAYIMRRQRKRPVNPNTFHSTLIFLPLLSGGIESQLPIPHDHVTLTREAVIHATPEEIWPYAVSNAHIKEGEGRWNFTQNILGMPRPRATVLNGVGKGALRTAYWGDNINFDEKITQWRPGRLLGWSFSFTNSSLQDYTDKHISPDGQFLKIDSGDYMLTPLTRDTTLLTLRTNYIAKTHVNPYAEFWGEILLGDIQNNVLAIIKQRAEVKHRQSVT
jgi:hypothetical protein